MTRYLLPVAAGLAVFAAGCEKREPARVTPKDVQRKVAEATDAAADYARQEKDEYVSRAQKAVDEARAEIDELGARARKAGARATGKLERQREAMETRWRLAERRLAELKAASGEAWKDLKSGVDRALEDLKASRRKDRRASRAPHRPGGLAEAADSTVPAGTLDRETAG